ncbi:chromate transporter [Scopulibacillus darangshiensis]|uniref:Chromate transporter n=1 Tax=Scopulibacillus darangshiensis TaxID=442528 RepID=A0A4R2NJZ9_9BACL|nr:chromate transporter [Scopulibacillus darangshiensis]TCP21648.1 chromate transporter [Scopulibacillus darangshiensis]
MTQYMNLFLAFFRVGMLGFGGGPSSIPLVHKEVVRNYKWMSEEEFSDVLALANTLPGPIGTKLPGYIGWKIKGTLGMLVSVLSSIVPTIFLMVVLLTFLASFQDKPWVRGMTSAVMPVVGVMLATLTWQFVAKARKGLGWTVSLGLAAGSLILMQLLHVHPAILIAALLIFALLKPDRKQDGDLSEEEGNRRVVK